MRIPLNSAVSKIFVCLLALFAAAAYTATTATQYLAAHFAAKTDLASLQRAVRLQPGNADYRYLVGRYSWLVQNSPAPAIEAYQQAVKLNPYQASYWFDMARVYQFLGDTDGQGNALEHAIQADPTTPEVAWEAANFYVVQGDNDKALKEFSVVLQNDPYLPPAALPICWRIQPDIDVLLRDVVPPVSSVYTSFLEFLTAKKESAAAAKVWAKLVQLPEPLKPRYVFEYMNYLVLQQDVDQARLVWQQAAKTSGLAAYQATPTNLIVNGGFNLPVLNGGFDWLYRKTGDVALALDPTQSHSGNRSLSLVFDSRGLEDAGIRQIIPVQPNTNYEFSAYFKSEDMQGAGGPEFVIQDLYSERRLFVSEDLKGADFWKHVTSEFLTGPDTKLVVLRIQRVPAGSPIKGKLWIDDLRLAPKPLQG